MDPVGEWDWADWFYFYSTVATFLTTIGVLGIIWQIIGERRTRHREFENMYVSRYWSIANNLPRRFVCGHPDYEANEKEVVALTEYLLLCEDELDLRMRGFVTDQTWEIWAEGICAASSDKKLRELASTFPPGRLTNFKTLLESGSSSFDPLAWSKTKRWWNGLR
ncbi:hypothetical protein [Glutamicibacter uratoxydans]|uniref:hypothetical protein n=1 Tax=Glutamicibacter uratoxydans TaxID=43667 RepID=UPI003D6EBEFE